MENTSITSTGKKKQIILTKRRQRSLKRFRELRKKSVPFAKAQGFLTDEDVFAEIS